MRSPARLSALAAAAAAAAVASLLACAPAADQGPYDVLIVNGLVLDGTGAPGVQADVAVRGDRIVRISEEPLARETAARVIDAQGKVVSPGFIDMHAHLEPLFQLPEAQSHARQGVTTAVGGPDGGGPWPFAPYLDSLEAVGVGINVAFLVGHNTIREEVMGLENRAPSAAELERMRSMVAQAMHEGAWGMSTGLIYLPGAYSNVDEVVALVEVAADSGGIYTSHLREEGLGLLDGVGEALEIGRRAEIPVVLTHHKVVGAAMWGSSTRTLAMIDSARAAGTDVMADQYPYTASHTGIGILVPGWAMAGGTRAFLDRLNDAALRDSIVEGIIFNIINDRGGNDLRRVQFSRFESHKELEGKTLHDWAVMRAMPSTPATGAQLVIEAIRNGGASASFHVLHEDDVERIMRHPQTMIASDGRLSTPGDGHPHPRAYGTFPRVLGHYARERQVLTLEDAVRKMTSLPAARLGLSDRGRVAEGFAADLVIFDPATVSDRATFAEPHQYAAGIDYVMVNGALAVDAGNFTGLRAGHVLRRGQAR
ncbi:MAG: D-aminoacylase [Gemmatimonadetes bacterium]|nr:D-aminoacylase [Gemmatimonadota bacterium]